MKEYYRKIVKNIELKGKNCFFAFFIIFVVFVFSLGVFFLFPENKEEGLSKNTKNPIATTTYPEYIDNEEDFLDLDVAAAFSFYHDSNNQTILYQENPDKLLPIASISKLMTALIVFESYDIEEPVRVTEQDIVSRTEFRDFRAWNETKIEDMIYQMLIESNNSAAFAMALISDRFLQDKGDPIVNFVNEMNQKAEDIGLNDTHFINPSGLDGKNKYNSSTAREIALFSRYILENKKIIFDISKRPSHKVFSPDGSIYYEALNTNNLLRSNKNEWQKRIVGGKTGWTYTAYGCLVLVLENSQKDGYIVNVVLGAGDRFEEMKKMVDHIYKTHRF